MYLCPCRKCCILRKYFKEVSAKNVSAKEVKNKEKNPSDSPNLCYRCRNHNRLRTSKDQIYSCKYRFCRCKLCHGTPIYEVVMPGRTLTRSKTIYSELKQEKLPFCDKKIKCETDQPVIKKKVIKNQHPNLAEKLMSAFCLPCESMPALYAVADLTKQNYNGALNALNKGHQLYNQQHEVD